MKKLFFAAAALLLSAASLLITPAAVRAETTQYAVVSEADAYLYANDTMTEADKLCILPKTYYVRIDAVYADYYAVFYMEDVAGQDCLYGFVKKSSVNLKQPEEQPYYFSKELVKIGTPKLHTVSPESDAGFAIAAPQRVRYYGDRYDEAGNRWYYVAVAGKLGYVLSDQIEPFEIPPHPDSVVVIPSPEPSSEPSGSGDNTAVTPGSTDNKMQIILIVAICIPAVIIVFLLFRGSGKPPRSRYRDTLNREKYPPYDKDNFDDE